VDGGAGSGNVGGTEGADVGGNHSEEAGRNISDGAGITGGAAGGNCIQSASLIKQAGDVLSLH